MGSARQLVLGLLLMASGTGMALDRSELHAQWGPLSARKDFAAAIPLYEQATREYPQEAWFFVYLAHSLRMVGRVEESLPHYETALALVPDDRVVRDNAYWGYMSAAWDAGFSRGDWAASAEGYLRAVAIDPDNFMAYNMLGNSLRNAGRVDDSFGYYRRSYELNRKENVEGGYGGNFRAGISSGLRDGGDKPAWAALGLEAFGNEPALQLEVVGAVAADPQGDWGAVKGRLQGSFVESVMEGALLAGKGEVDKAYRAFDRASRASSDPQLDEAIARICRRFVGTLPYPEQMQSPMQDMAVEFYTRAKDKYFSMKPYHQSITFLPPLHGEFCSSQTEGGRSFHLGIYGHYSYDLNGCDGDRTMGLPVYAVADGEVEAVVDDQPDQPVGSPVDLKAVANWIRIRHADGTKSSYAHHRQGSALVRVGDKVRAGQRIAAIGNSGVSTGPHLHFSLANDEGATLPVRFSQVSGHPHGASGAFRSMTVLKPDHRFRFATNDGRPAKRGGSKREFTFQGWQSQPDFDAFDRAADFDKFRQE